MSLSILSNGFHMGVAMMLKLCEKSITRVLHGCFKGVKRAFPGLLQGHYKVLTGMLHTFFKGIHVIHFVKFCFLMSKEIIFCKKRLFSTKREYFMQQ